MFKRRFIDMVEILTVTFTWSSHNFGKRVPFKAQKSKIWVSVFQKVTLDVLTQSSPILNKKNNKQKNQCRKFCSYQGLQMLSFKNKFYFKGCYQLMYLLNRPTHKIWYRKFHSRDLLAIILDWQTLGPYQVRKTDFSQIMMALECICK